MLEAMGPFEFVRVSRTLWMVVAIPMIGVLWHAFVARSWIRGCSWGGPTTARAIDSARLAGLVAVSLTAAAFLAHVAQLRGSGTSGRLIEGVVAAAPIGLLDTSLVLALDRLSATWGTVVCVVGLAAAARLASRPAAQRGWAAWAWLEFALGCTLVSLLADGVWTIAIGWATTTIACAWLLASDDGRASVAMGGRGALALGALLIGGAIVFSSLDCEPRSRFVAERVGWPEASSEPESHTQLDEGGASRPSSGSPEAGDAPTGTVTLASPPGAQVLVDDADSPALRAPFVRAVVAAGHHVLHIRTGLGAEDCVVAVDVAPGDDVTLVARGPTLSFHAMASEFALGDGHGAKAPRSILAAGLRGAESIPAAWAAMVAWIVGASLMGCVPMAARSPAPLSAFASGLIGPTVGPYLLARASFLRAFAPSSGPLMAAVGGIALTTVLVRSRARPAGAGLAVLSSGAPAALALLALGALPPDYAVPALPLLVLAGSGVALFTARRPPRGTAALRIEEWPFVDASEHLGRFCVRVDRWVVGAWIAAASAVARTVAWGIAAGEETVARRVGDSAASCAVRCADDVEPMVGAPLERVVWAALGLLAAAALAHALWTRG